MFTLFGIYPKVHKWQETKTYHIQFYKFFNFLNFVYWQYLYDTIL